MPLATAFFVYKALLKALLFFRYLPLPVKNLTKENRTSFS